VIRRSQSAASLAIALDRTSEQPLYRQVYHQLREIILGGRVATGAALPSTRTLARELGVSRTTLALAFDQLHADGYIDGRAGSGTYVAALPIAPARAAALDRSPATSRPSYRCSPLAQRLGDYVIARDRYLRAFRPGLPETELFPLAVWRRLISKFWKRPPTGLLYSAPPAGYEPLRSAIADYVRAARGVICTPGQVIVTSGTQDAINLVARTLISRGDKVWVEDPGYPNARYPLLAAGAKLVSVAVDGRGMSVDLGKQKAPHARLAMVTPSRQYPLGMTMDLSRRLELLEWARNIGAWIVEDDYDAEYRYAGPPVSALQGLDKDSCVIYTGTFSKLMFRTLRLGYIIVPGRVLDSFLRVRIALDGQMPIALQPALAEFIETGQFAKHVRRMRVLYAERQEILITEVNRALSDHLQAQPDGSGMHIVAKLRPRSGGGRGDTRLSDLAALGLADTVPRVIHTSDHIGLRPRETAGDACLPAA
jgi:GntR family transcriptional regulator / MocR family aminotransferase